MVYAFKNAFKLIEPSKTMRKRGFTLVELLVVITIIVVLLTMLTPALDKATEMARRAVCAANLRNWGSAHGLYYIDNKRQLPEPVRLYGDVQHGGDGWIYSSIAWVWSQPDKAGRTGQLSAQMYAGYNGAMSVAAAPTYGPGPTAYAPGAPNPNSVQPGSYVSKVFLCPANARYDDRRDRNNSAAQHPPGPQKGAGDVAPDEGGPTVESDYSYFARVSRWARSDGDTSGNTGNPATGQGVNAGNAGGQVRAPWPPALPALTP